MRSHPMWSAVGACGVQTSTERVLSKLCVYNSGPLALDILRYGMQRLFTLVTGMCCLVFKYQLQ
jgi:hypothetical protein